MKKIALGAAALVDASIDRGYSSARLPSKPKGYDK